MLYPKATKTSLVSLLRDRGFDVPSIRQAIFERHGHSYWLRWSDKENNRHTAYYTGADGRPVLQVDKQWIELAWSEVIQHGLVEEK